MAIKRYNGWINYETWNVALWMDNDQDSYNEFREKADEAIRETDPTDDPETRKREATSALAEIVKERITDAAPDLGSSTYADLLGAALSEVDWHEIAAHHVDEMFQDIADEEKADAASLEVTETKETEV